MFALNRYVLFEWLLQSTEGVHPSWEDLLLTMGKITEYSVFSSVRKAAANVNQESSGLSCVAQTCMVRAVRLASAHLNYTTKPAIIFKIAASLIKDTVMSHKSGDFKVCFVKYIKYCFLKAMK